MPNERSGFNQLTAEIYSGLSTTRRDDSAGDLPRAEGVTFSTQYPAGIHGDAELFIPRDPTQSWLFTGGDRLVLRNGQSIAWEGTIAGIGYLSGTGAAQGRRIIGQGWWGTLMGKRGWEKPWADQRLSMDAWVWDTTGSGTDKFIRDHQNRLYSEPKAVALANTDIDRWGYTMPTGVTRKRIDLTYKNVLGTSGCYGMRAYGPTAGTGSTLFTVTTAASAACSLSGASAEQITYLEHYSRAAQTGVSGGSQFGRYTSVTIFSTIAASVTASNIGLDVITRANVAAASPINGDLSKVAGPTFVLEPFISNGYEMLGDILLRATGYGDASFNSWAAYLDHSETAATPDGTPVLVQEQYPALTDYDYAVRLDDPNVVPPLEIVKDFDSLFNWIVVRYRDELNNRDVYLTPDDNAALKDAASITDWGQRETVLNAGQATSATAANVGQRYLAAHKDPRFYVQGPITVQGYIRAKNGNPVPSSLIRAGKRVKVDNFLTDEVGTSGAGLTFIISRTVYRDRDETCAIDCGVPDNLAVLLAQMARTAQNT